VRQRAAHSCVSSRRRVPPCHFQFHPISITIHTLSPRVLVIVILSRNRGFASDDGAAPWPSGGEESRSCCPALLQAAWQAVSWRPVRCAGEASGAGPAARGRAAAGTARWARASCFSTCNKVVVQSRAEGLKICSTRGKGHGGRWFYRTRTILGAADVSCRSSALLLVAGRTGRSWGGVGSVLARALKRGDFRPPASTF